MDASLFLLLADSSAYNAGRDLSAVPHVLRCECQECRPVEMPDEVLFVPMACRCMSCGNPMTSDVFVRCADCEVARIDAEEASS